MPTTEDLCRELAKLHKKHAADFARVKEIKKLLTSGATENFQHIVRGIGVVRVSAPRDGECTGQAPEIAVDAFLELPKKVRDKLIKDGIVAIVDQKRAAYYGSVTVELF